MRIAGERDEDNNIIEEVLEIIVRGKTISLTANLINSYMGIENAPIGPFKEFSEPEIFKILKPGEELGSLTFSPTMSD